MKHGPQRILVTADSVQPGMLLTSPRDIDHRHDGGYIASFADGHIEYMKGDIPLEIK